MTRSYVHRFSNLHDKKSYLGINWTMFGFMEFLWLYFESHSNIYSLDCVTKISGISPPFNYPTAIEWIMMRSGKKRAKIHLSFRRAFWIIGMDLQSLGTSIIIANLRRSIRCHAMQDYSLADRCPKGRTIRIRLRANSWFLYF